MGFNRALLAWLSVGVGVIAIGTTAAPAAGQGNGFTLSLSSAPSGTVGTPFAITGSGTDPTDEGALYLEIDAIPASFTTTCPSGYLDGSSVAANSGGSFVAFDQRENFDANGSFSNVNAYTAKAAGGVLFCGYTDDGAGDTLAIASEVVNFGKPGSKPQDTAKPHVTRAGNQLRCGRGIWTGSPKSFAYRWLVDGKVKAGATGRTLAVTHKLRGHKVQCGVKASNSGGSASALSAAFHVH
jgi:hypothetical protein